MSIFDRFRKKKPEKADVEINENVAESEIETPVEVEDTSLDQESIIEKVDIARIELVVESEIEAEVEVETEAQAEKEVEAEEEKKEPVLSLFKRMKNSLSKTRENITGKIEDLVKKYKAIDEDFWEEIEEILIQADCGVNVSLELVERMRKRANDNKLKDTSEIIRLLQDEVIDILGGETKPVNLDTSQPTIIMVVGVNGVGKTTSIAKLAHRYKQEGRKVMLVAGDTFRAAAIDQLQIWADRVGVDMIKHQEGSDPGAVVFDALSALGPRKIDVMIIDTAGRLQNKTNLMNEIGKVRKIIDRERPGAPQEVLLVLDATTGQNAISQAKVFSEVTGVTGIILTKLDGTAKGGIVIALAGELSIPVKLVGIGETLDDLRDFSPEVFAQALCQNGDD